MTGKLTYFENNMAVRKASITAYRKSAVSKKMEKRQTNVNNQD